MPFKRFFPIFFISLLAMITMIMAQSRPQTQPLAQYSLLIDAGSTGSRLSIYHYDLRQIIVPVGRTDCLDPAPTTTDTAADTNPSNSRCISPPQLLTQPPKPFSRPVTNSTMSKKIVPGLHTLLLNSIVTSTVSIRNDVLSEDHTLVYDTDIDIDLLRGEIMTNLGPLIKFAIDQFEVLGISDQIQYTPIFLLATGGVRSLLENEQNVLMGQVRGYLSSTGFYLQDNFVTVVSGELEGLFGWISVNYLLSGAQIFSQIPNPQLQLKQQHQQSPQLGHFPGTHTTLQSIPTPAPVGVIDLGGATLQMALSQQTIVAQFNAYNKPNTSSHHDTNQAATAPSTFLSSFPFELGDHNSNIFVQCFWYFGKDTALFRVHNLLYNVLYADELLAEQESLLQARQRHIDQDFDEHNSNKAINPYATTQIHRPVIKSNVHLVHGGWKNGNSLPDSDGNGARDSPTTIADSDGQITPHQQHQEQKQQTPPDGWNYGSSFDEEQYNVQYDEDDRSTSAAIGPTFQSPPHHSIGPNTNDRNSADRDGDSDGGAQTADIFRKKMMRQRFVKKQLPHHWSNDNLNFTKYQTLIDEHNYQYHVNPSLYDQEYNHFIENVAQKGERSIVNTTIPTHNDHHSRPPHDIKHTRVFGSPCLPTGYETTFYPYSQLITPSNQQGNFTKQNHGGSGDGGDDTNESTVLGGSQTGPKVDNQSAKRSRNGHKPSGSSYYDDSTNNLLSNYEIVITGEANFDDCYQLARQLIISRTTTPCYNTNGVHQTHHEPPMDSRTHQSLATTTASNDLHNDSSKHGRGKVSPAGLSFDEINKTKNIKDDGNHHDDDNLDDNKSTPEPHHPRDDENRAHDLNTAKNSDTSSHLPHLDPFQQSSPPRPIKPPFTGQCTSFFGQYRPPYDENTPFYLFSGFGYLGKWLGLTQTRVNNDISNTIKNQTHQNRPESDRGKTEPHSSPPPPPPPPPLDTELLFSTQAVNVTYIMEKGREICSKSELELLIAYPDEPKYLLHRYCWFSAYISALLHDGFRFEKDSNQIHFVSNVNGTDVTYSQGAMVHLVNQLPYYVQYEFDLPQSQSGELLGSGLGFNQQQQQQQPQSPDLDHHPPAETSIVWLIILPLILGCLIAAVGFLGHRVRGLKRELKSEKNKNYSLQSDHFRSFGYDNLDQTSIRNHFDSHGTGANTANLNQNYFGSTYQTNPIEIPHHSSGSGHNSPIVHDGTPSTGNVNNQFHGSSYQTQNYPQNRPSSSLNQHTYQQFSPNGDQNLHTDQNIPQPGGFESSRLLSPSNRSDSVRSNLSSKHSNSGVNLNRIGQTNPGKIVQAQLRTGGRDLSNSFSNQGSGISQNTHNYNPTNIDNTIPSHHSINSRGRNDSVQTIDGPNKYISFAPVILVSPDSCSLSNQQPSSQLSNRQVGHQSNMPPNITDLSPGGQSPLLQQKKQIPSPQPPVEDNRVIEPRLFFPTTSLANLPSSLTANTLDTATVKTTTPDSTITGHR